MSPIWFVNYSPNSKIRTTEIKLCYKLKEAKQFIAGNDVSGFLIRQDNIGNQLKGFFGDFKPSAQQEQMINNLLEV